MYWLCLLRNHKSFITVFPCVQGVSWTFYLPSLYQLSFPKANIQNLKNCLSSKMLILKQNHKTKKQLGLEGASGISWAIWVSSKQGHPEQVAEGCVQWGFNISGDEGTTTSLGNLCQCLTTFSVTDFQLQQSWSPSLAMKNFCWIQQVFCLN